MQTLNKKAASPHCQQGRALFWENQWHCMYIKLGARVYIWGAQFPIHVMKNCSFNSLFGLLLLHLIEKGLKRNEWTTKPLSSSKQLPYGSCEVCLVQCCTNQYTYMILIYCVGFAENGKPMALFNIIYIFGEWIWHAGGCLLPGLWQCTQRTISQKV